MVTRLGPTRQPRSAWAWAALLVLVSVASAGSEVAWAVLASLPSTGALEGEGQAATSGTSSRVSATMTVGIARIHAGNRCVSCSQSRFIAAAVFANRQVMSAPMAVTTSPTSSRSSEVGDRTSSRSGLDASVDAEPGSGADLPAGPAVRSRVARGGAPECGEAEESSMGAVWSGLGGAVEHDPTDALVGAGGSHR